MKLSRQARLALAAIAYQDQPLGQHALQVIPPDLYRTRRTPERHFAGKPIPVLEVHTLTDEGWAIAERARAELEAAHASAINQAVRTEARHSRSKPQRVKWKVSRRSARSVAP